jgi:hypothetical protein
VALVLNPDSWVAHVAKGKLIQLGRYAARKSLFSARSI